MIESDARPTWMRDAACVKATDLSIFFEEDRPTCVRAARKMCTTCAVKDLCLQHALDNKEVGVWGGTTTNQRAKMMRHKRIVSTQHLVAQ